MWQAPHHKQMPTEQYTNVWYPKYNIDSYHKRGIYGQDVSVYVIDTGLTNTTDTLANVQERHVGQPNQKTKAHGSFVASILAASPKQGHSGIAPEAKIYVNDVSNASGTIYTSSLTKAIQDAVDLSVDIISISLGTTVYDKSLEHAVKRAIDHDILVFAAAGNCSCRTYEFPAACDHAISVASIDQYGNPSPFNTRNDAVAVFAPGQNIIVPGTKDKLSGTSFATPFASGLVALELSKRRQHERHATMSRSEAISFLRTSLELDCERHSYARNVCDGPAIPVGPNESSGLFGFLLVFLGGAIVGLYLTAWIHRKLPKDTGLSGGATYAPGPLTWFNLK